MEIQEVHVRRFKSLYNVKVSLGNFTVFTGPNGSGKSNLFSALDFLGETYRYGLETALARSGGLDSIAYRRNRRTTVPVEFSITAKMGPEDLRRRLLLRGIREFLRDNYAFVLKHQFGLKPSRNVGDSTFTVSSEELELFVELPGDREGGSRNHSVHIASISATNVEGERKVVFEHTKSDIYDRLTGPVFTKPDEFEAYVNETLLPTELIISAGGSMPAFRDFRVALADLQVYRLNPTDCRAPGIMTPNATLERSGKNLPGVIANLRRYSQGRRRVLRYGRTGEHTSKLVWQEIVQSMAEILPGLVDIDTSVNASGGLELQFVESGVGRAWSAQEVSDGTIQYLALLAVMLDQVSPVLIVEEPEKALHSWLLRTFLEKCRSGLGTQVLMTTHSPVALRFAKPFEVALTWKREGKTDVQRLVDVDPNAQSLYDQEGIDVFEQYDSGFLPYSLPGEAR